MKLSTRGTLLTIILWLLALILFSSCTGMSSGTLTGKINAGTGLMLVQINEIKPNGAISVTMRGNLILSTKADEKFVFTNVPPGRYLLFNNSIMMALFMGSGKDKVDTEFNPFPIIEYEDALKLTTNFYLSTFVSADDKIVVFTVKPMGTVNIDRPIFLRY